MAFFGFYDQIFFQFLILNAKFLVVNVWDIIKLTLLLSPVTRSYFTRSSLFPISDSSNHISGSQNLFVGQFPHYRKATLLPW